LKNQIEILKNGKEADGSAAPTMLNALLDPRLPEQERTTQRVFGEASVIFSAAAPAAAATLANATFHLLSNPGILRMLKMELEAAIPDVNGIPTLHQVENSPYLVRASLDYCL
jgi:hypothetical protein